MKKFTIFLLVAVLVLGVSVMAGAEVVTLPGTATQTTTFTAIVAEQADVTVPATVIFNILDVTNSTTGTGAVSATSIVLFNTKSLMISLQGDAAAFTPPTGGTTTWAVGDVSWAAAPWDNGTSASGTLSNTAYNEVATSVANAPSTGSTTTITFTLAAKAAASPAIWAGNHTLVARWKFESL